jgi:hypothetical protein
MRKHQTIIVTNLRGLGSMRQLVLKLWMRDFLKHIFMMTKHHQQQHSQFSGLLDGDKCMTYFINSVLAIVIVCFMLKHLHEPLENLQDHHRPL